VVLLPLEGAQGFLRFDMEDFFDYLDFLFIEIRAQDNEDHFGFTKLVSLSTHIYVSEGGYKGAANIRFRVIYNIHPSKAFLFSYYRVGEAESGYFVCTDSDHYLLFHGKVFSVRNKPYIVVCEEDTVAKMYYFYLEAI